MKNIISINLMIILVIGSANTNNQVLPIENLDFEQEVDGKPAHWYWWSRTGDPGKVELTSDEKHQGQYSVIVEFGGSNDWAFVNRNYLTLEPGDGYQFSAWIKVDHGEVIMSIVNSGNGKKLEGESSNSVKSESGKSWQYVELINEVPEGTDQLDIRFRGEGPVRAWIDDVQIKKHRFKEIAADNPKVKGFAKQRVKEKLDRGLIARPTKEGHVYLGWRLLEEDSRDAGFNVYRRIGNGNPIRINNAPLTKTTDFMDRSVPGGQALSYHVRTVVGGEEMERSKETVIQPEDKTKPYISIPLQGDYQFQKVGIADLDGNGRYDFVIKQPHDNIDPYYKYWKKSPDTYKLEAYNADGEFLWRYDLGWAIERGIWYSPYLVYDFNGDGRAEVAVKTGEGDPRDSEGRVQSGPEYLTVLDGQSGKEIAQTQWLPREPFSETRKFYNYSSRNQLGVAYLDGKTPFVIVGRGTYGMMMAKAIELKGDRLPEHWRWDNLNMRRKHQGQGAHWMHGVDLDNDGRQEVSLGSLVLDDNGSVLWSTGLGHPDHHYIGDIDPGRPGLEIYYGIESRQDRNGMSLVDGRTGEILWSFEKPTNHVHSTGMCSDIIAKYPGTECYSSDRDKDKDGNRFITRSILWSNTGEVIRDDLDWGFGIFTVYWNVDPQRELLRSGRIKEFEGKEYDVQIEGRIVAVADILGDWREEIITSVEGELRIYTTTIPAKDRHVSLMQDSLYRNDVAMAAMGYYQIPMLSYDLASRVSKH